MFREVLFEIASNFLFIVEPLSHVQLFVTPWTATHQPFLSFTISRSCSCLGNPMDRGAWQAPNHGVLKELDTTQQLNNMQQAFLIFFLCSGIQSKIPHCS